MKWIASGCASKLFALMDNIVALIAGAVAREKKLVFQDWMSAQQGAQIFLK